MGNGPRSERALTALAAIEDVMYAVIALFLIVSGVLLLFGAGRYLIVNFDANKIHPLIVTVLDDTLLVFMVAELLHTVRITLRDHRLAAEPFLIVGLIAGVRRILILTANTESVRSGADLVQLLLLIVLVVSMVVALFIWRRSHPPSDDS